MNIPNEVEKNIKEAIDFFWLTRSGQMRKQSSVGVRDQGNRGAVTGGKQLDGFVNLIRTILINNGVPEKCIYTDSELELPGFYRPNKKWDLLVVDEQKLIAAIEFKSQVGPSFGNNFNNRTEEAMGSALDLWTAYREGGLGLHMAPWVGYFLVLEDCDKSNTPVSTRSPHFPIREEFENASYKRRFEIFCQKLVLERQYNGACFIATSRNDNGGEYCYPNKDLSFNTFIRSLIAAVEVNFN